MAKDEAFEAWWPDSSIGLDTKDAQRIAWDACWAARDAEIEAVCKELEALVTLNRELMGGANCKAGYIALQEQAEAYDSAANLLRSRLLKGGDSE